MSERVASGDGLVRLHRNAGDFAQQLAGGKQMLTGNAGLVRITIAAHVHRHHNLFESGVAGALADAVNGALHLTGAGVRRPPEVGDRHSEIIVAVSRNSDVLDSLDAAANGCDQTRRIPTGTV